MFAYVAFIPEISENVERMCENHSAGGIAAVCVGEIGVTDKELYKKKRFKKLLMRRLHTYLRSRQKRITTAGKRQTYLPAVVFHFLISATGLGS